MIMNILLLKMVKKRDDLRFTFGGRARGDHSPQQNGQDWLVNPSDVLSRADSSSPGALSRPHPPDQSQLSRQSNAAVRVDEAGPLYRRTTRRVTLFPA